MEKPQPMSHRAKMVTSFSIWFGTFSIGVAGGLMGPSLVAFSIKFDTDIATVSNIFIINEACVILGALTCGALFNYVNRQLASAVLLIIMGSAIIIIPLVPTLRLFFFVYIINGFTHAGYNTAQIVWMIELWEDNAAAFIQTQHFSWAAGNLLSPLIIRPFLSESRPNEKIELSSSQNLGLTHSEVQHISVDNAAPLLYVPFLIGGIIAITSGLLIFVVYKFRKYEKQPSNRHSRGGESKSQVYEPQTSKSYRKFLLLALASLFLGFYVGMEGSANHFLASFSHFISLGLSQREAASVQSAFSGAFTAGRGIGIPIVLRVPSEMLLTGNLTIVLIGNYLLSFANESSMALYVAVILLGFGYSTVFASFFGFLERYLEIGNIEGAILVAAEKIVCGIYPFIIGRCIEKSPFILLEANLISSFLATIVFILIWNIVKNSIFKHVAEYNMEDEWLPVLDHSD